MILLISFLLIDLINCIEFSSSDCGNSDKYLTINNYTVNPHPVKYPGSVMLTINMDVLKDMPTDGLKMKISAERISPSKLRIPCMFGVGSCTIDYCDFWKDVHNIVQNPNAVPVCPLVAGHYVYDRGNVVIPTFGILNFFLGVMEGDFSANLTFFDSKANKMLGCSHINFSLEMKKDKKRAKLHFG